MTPITKNGVMTDEQLPVPAWICIKTPGADFDISFFKTEAGARDAVSTDVWEEPTKLFTAGQLREAITALAAERDVLKFENARLQEIRQTLEAERDALRADALRWRHAREQDGVTVSIETADDDGDMCFVSGHSPTELDTEIDAAMKGVRS